MFMILLIGNTTNYKYSNLYFKVIFVGGQSEFCWLKKHLKLFIIYGYFFIFFKWIIILWNHGIDDFMEIVNVVQNKKNNIVNIILKFTYEPIIKIV